MLHGPLAKNEAEALLVYDVTDAEGRYLLRSAEKGNGNKFVLSVVHNAEPVHVTLERTSKTAPFTIDGNNTLACFVFLF
jgi:hypothetical protein